MQFDNDTPTQRPDWRQWLVNDRIDTDTAHLWRLDLDQIRGDEELLSDTERTRLLGLSSSLQRRRFVAGRTVLRELLGRALERNPTELALDRSDTGKPLLRGQPALNFNLSHSGALALVGLCRKAAVGVDIEPLKKRANLNAVARRILPAEKADRIAKTRNPQEKSLCFTREWVCFEARQKMTGHGIFGDRTCPEHQLRLIKVSESFYGAIAISSPTPVAIQFWQFGEFFDAR